MIRNSMRTMLVSLLALMLGQAASAQPESTVVGFDGGSNGGFGGNAFFESEGGNPAGNAHFFLETFGIELRTGALGEPANPSFLGDYSAFSNIVFGVDVRVDTLQFFGNPVPHNLGVALIDRDIQGPSGASGVWYPLGVISEALTPDWTRLEVVIEDPTQAELPAGWIGFGDEDPDTFMPILPKGASFATVLASVDEVRITTFEPGFFYGFTVFDVRVDNVRVDVTSPCVGDLDGNGAVDVDDLLAVLAAWGNTEGPEDLDENGMVDVDDLLLLLGAWGPCV